MSNENDNTVIDEATSDDSNGANDIEGSKSSNSNDSESVLIVNTLLTYAEYCMSCASPDNMRQVLCSHFTIDEITDAKEILWDSFDLGELPKRANSANRSACEAHISDIMNALYSMDSSAVKHTFYVDPKGIARLPRFNPENLNVVALDQRVAELNEMCSVMQAQINSYRSLSMQCNDRMDSIGTILQQHTNALRDVRGHPFPAVFMAPSKSVNDTKSSPTAVVTMPSYATAVSSNQSDMRSSSNMTSLATHSAMTSPLSCRPLDVRSRSPQKQNNNSESVPIPTHITSPPVHIDNPSVSGISGDDGFQKPAEHQRRERKQEKRRNKVVHGSAEHRDGGFRGAPKTPVCDLFIYHVEHDSTVHDLRNYLTNRGINITKLRIDVTSHVDAYFKSFRIIAPMEQIDSLLSSELWPRDVRIKEYVSPRNKRSGQFPNKQFNRRQ